MKTLIKILCLSVLWFSCEDDSEIYFDIDIYHTNTDIMMQFSDNLDLSQFDFRYFIDILSSPSEDNFDNEFFNDTLGVYFISNPEIFGTDCYLFYDDNKKTLSGYIETTEIDGQTGYVCKPEYLNNLKSQNGFITDQIFDNLTAPDSIYVSPNPYFVPVLFETDDVIELTFNQVPPYSQIQIYDGNKELVDEFQTLWDPVFWNLRDSNNQEVQSGAYYYEIFEPIGDQQTLLKQGSLIIIQRN